MVDDAGFNFAFNFIQSCSVEEWHRTSLKSLSSSTLTPLTVHREAFNFAFYWNRTRDARHFNMISCSVLFSSSVSHQLDVLILTININVIPKFHHDSPNLAYHGRGPCSINGVPMASPKNHTLSGDTNPVGRKTCHRHLFTACKATILFSGCSISWDYYIPCQNWTSGGLRVRPGNRFHLGKTQLDHVPFPLAGIDIPVVKIP